MFLVTLAAALAESGRFEEAVRTAVEARDVARAAGAGQMAAQIDTLIDRLRQRKPVRPGP
jgi:hypothetical protein